MEAGTLNMLCKCSTLSYVLSPRWPFLSLNRNSVPGHFCHSSTEECYNVCKACCEERENGESETEAGRQRQTETQGETVTGRGGEGIESETNRSRKERTGQREGEGRSDKVERQVGTRFC